MHRVAGGEHGDCLVTLVQQGWTGGGGQASNGKEIKDETRVERRSGGEKMAVAPGIS